MLKQSQQSAEEVELPEVTVSVVYGSATLARFEGDLDSARELLERNAEQMQGPTWAPQFRSMVRSTQGLVEAAAGNTALARKFHAEAIRMAFDTRDQPVVALVLVGVADLVLREGDPERAAYLLGVADAIRGAVDS
jgi:ATP/maltotriose-dependent transcriptional regulator MalT